MVAAKKKSLGNVHTSRNANSLKTLWFFMFYLENVATRISNLWRSHKV